VQTAKCAKRKSHNCTTFVMTTMIVCHVNSWWAYSCSTFISGHSAC